MLTTIIKLQEAAPDMLSGRVRADYSDWLRADQPSDTHHSSACQNWSWCDAPEFEPEGYKEMKPVKNNR